MSYLLIFAVLLGFGLRLKDLLRRLVVCSGLGTEMEMESDSLFSKAHRGWEEAVGVVASVLVGIDGLVEGESMPSQRSRGHRVSLGAGI